MAILDFPSNPTDGQQYTVGGLTYTYDASKTYWRVAKTALSKETLDAIKYNNIYKLYLAGQ